ncbi:aminotransferase class I/II-fold pyridoxal phosphate-dependent enzyme [Emcibacter nanhaiensis]|uniref:Aminotransferase class I/II-fold pyridoxal phosphate-dependent enzyme n=2 Tax=Emcibacter nanhaiensis TaxID=1505037 RepID=A0A501PH24_9PROT|nr:aminotransferase class I/II-fold pyridoxal phosphate-dependent enzyme [Emcibacter nanhaiensis]
MRALLNDIESGDPGGLNMSLGEPQHEIPEFVAEILYQERASYHKYPPVAGTPDWQQAVGGWLERRFGLDEGMLGADHLVPLCGSREGLFAIGFVTIDRQKAGGVPLVLMPNPFYQPYAGAAIAANAEPFYVNAEAENGFLPDYEALPEEVLERTALCFICNPANPQGSFASLDYLKKAIRLARKYDFVLVGDECYSEIYDAEAPVGILQACMELVSAGEGDPENPFDHVVCFNSLSKRSNLAGLRSAFMAGDPVIAAECRRLRNYGGSPLPLPVDAASAAAWRDEEHVIANRALYRRKFDLAEKYLAGRFDFSRPSGGFCLWLRVGDGEQAARALWREAGIKVLPGAYLAREDRNGVNPGAGYIRLTLVHGEELLEPALAKIATIL